MTRKDIFTTKRGNQWANIIGGNQRASGLFDTQKEAIESAKERAKRDGLEHTIQGMDGKFREKNSYGNDPTKIKG